MKNIDKSVLYGIIGFLLGIVLTSVVFMSNSHRGWDKGEYYKKDNSSMVHQMPDGKMMDNMGMESSMSGMMMGLEGKTGEEFDKAFLSEMIVHHEGAVDMAQMVLTTSKRPELTKLAGEIITAQTKEIRMMKDWQKSWYK